MRPLIAVIWNAPAGPMQLDQLLAKLSRVPLRGLALGHDGLLVR